MDIKKHIPNLFTALNLFFGSISISYAFRSYIGYELQIDILVWASYFILIAAVFDFLDGFSARLLNTQSEVGRQLDSLADMISFGMAPAAIIWAIFHHSLDLLYFEMINNGKVSLKYAEFLNFKEYVAIIVFILPVFAAFRLAKFNVDTRQTKDFYGLPTPAVSIFLAAFPLMLKYDFLDLKSFILNVYFLLAIVFSLSILMISEIRLFSLKFDGFSFQKNKVRFIFLVISTALLAVFRFYGLPIVILAYLAISSVENALKKSIPDELKE